MKNTSKVSLRQCRTNNYLFNLLPLSRIYSNWGMDLIRMVTTIYILESWNKLNIINIPEVPCCSMLLVWWKKPNTNTAAYTRLFLCKNPTYNSKYRSRKNCWSKSAIILTRSKTGLEKKSGKLVSLLHDTVILKKPSQLWTHLLN